MKEQVHITKLNESFLRVSCDRHIENEIWTHFTFKAENYKFDPRYKSRQWDGNLRFFKISDKTIYVGLLNELVKFIRKQGYEEVLDSSVTETEELNYSLYDKITKNFLDKKYNVYDYQEASVKHAISERRGICVSPTASGKSLIIYLITLFYLLNKKNKILIVVPRTSLVLQFIGDFKDYAKGTKINIDNFVHQVYSGKDKDTDKNIVVTTWQSIDKMPDEWYQQFEVCLFDEAHTCKAKTLKYILEKCTNAKYRYGFTGTLTNEGETSNLMALKGLFGEPDQQVETKELIDRKILSPIKINSLRFKYKDRDFLNKIQDIRKKYPSKEAFQKEQEFILQLPIRNRFIRNLAIHLKGNTIIFFNLIEQHGDVLFAEINDEATKAGKKVYMYHGGVKATERERIRKEIETRDDLIILASYGVASTGVNIKNLHNAIFASAFKASIIVRQTIGRGLRTAKDKEIFTVYDIGDDFTDGGKEKNNFLFSHFIERLRIYKRDDLNFNVYEYTIDKEGFKNG